MKEKLISALGWFGLILYFGAAILIVFAPTYILGFPFWLKSLLLLVYFFAPTLMSYAVTPLYIWAIIVALRQPIDVVSIVFFVIAAVYFLVILVPTVAGLFSKK